MGARGDALAVLLDGRLACTRIGGPLLFGRLWERLGLGAVVNELVEGRGFEFALERAVFVSVLHRLFVSGSDRSCEKWMGDYAIPGIDGLRLHHLYRAMSWLGEEAEPAAEGDLAPRCVKDAIEEGLFERRRDLFTEMSLVFMDTTTLSFHGAGGETLGAHGHSKDHRPDLRQMVVAAVLDGEGRPVCTEMLPGNTADTTVLLPIVDRLRSRFGIGRVCVVADRGMISAATIKALEERGLDYILGARERGTAAVREVVLRDSKPFVPLLIERGRGDTQLFVKEVAVDGARYIVCRNEAEVEKDRADRQAVVDGLQRRLAGGEKALIGNRAYRRYLRRTGAGKAFEIDAGKLADEARFDGIFVLRTNARMTPLNAVLRYRELLQVEDLFRRAKAQLRTRPIYHSRDAAIRGHVFCSFLALVLQKELADRCRAAGVSVEWDDLIRDLDRLQETTRLHVRQHHRPLGMTRQRGDQAVELAAGVEGVLAAERADRALAHPPVYRTACPNTSTPFRPRTCRFPHRHPGVDADSRRPGARPILRGAAWRQAGAAHGAVRRETTIPGKPGERSTPSKRTWRRSASPSCSSYPQARR